MRRAAKIDANQNDIVKSLRVFGATVQSLATIGDGAPDLLVGYRGYNILMEVKDSDKPPSKRKLNNKQIKWHDAWRGQSHKIETATEAIQLCRDIHAVNFGEPF